MEKYIIIALILLFGVVYYFDKQSDDQLAALEQSSTLEIDKNKPKKRTWAKSITNAIKNKNRPNDGIRRVGSNKPDSDMSQCQWDNLSPDQKIKTNFAGYVLEYPCTTGKDGGYQLEYSVDGKLLSQRYTLYLGAVLGQKNGSIWWNGVYDNENTKSFSIELINNGSDVSYEHLRQRISKATKIKENESKGFVVYEEQRNIIAFLKNDINIDGSLPIITCDRYGEVDPYELFSPFHNIGKKSQCNIFWKLTNDIKVWVQWIPSKYAYHFNEIYEAINEGLQQIIIERPNNPPKLRES